MKVLSFSYCFPRPARPTWGVFVLRRLSALARQKDVSLEVVAPTPVFPIVTRLRSTLPPAKSTIDGVPVYYPRYFSVPGIMSTRGGWFYGRGLTPWVRRYCENGAPDLLDAHFIWPDGVGVSNVARALRIPYTITLRGALWVYFRNEDIRRQCVRALQGADAVIALSESMVEFCRDLGVPSDKFTVVHNGVDRTLFRLGDKLTARRSLGLSTEGRLVVCVSYYQQRKGIMELVRAMACLPEDVRLVLVGSKVSHEAAYYRAVIQEIEHLGLSHRILRVGQQPHERIPDYFRAADVSVLASYWEGCPNAVVESLACGTPVIATPVGSVPEIIVPGENGSIVPVRDVETLGEAIREALDREWASEELSRNMRSWDEVGADVYNVLRQTVGSASSSGH